MAAGTVLAVKCKPVGSAFARLGDLRRVSRGVVRARWRRRGGRFCQAPTTPTTSRADDEQ